MACDIRGLINDVLAIRSAITGPDPVKNGWRAAIDAQDKGWTCAYGNGVGILSASDTEKAELKAACDGVLEDVAKAEAKPNVKRWGDGKFLDFIKFLIPILIGIIFKEGEKP